MSTWRRAAARSPNDAGLTRTIKGAIVLLDAALAAIIFLLVKRRGRPAPRRVGGGRVLAEPRRPDGHDARIRRRGAGDSLRRRAGGGSYGRPWAAGALFAAAVLTKPQGLLIAPAVLLALWNAGGAPARLARLFAAVAPQPSPRRS